MYSTYAEALPSCFSTVPAPHTQMIAPQSKFSETGTLRYTIMSLEFVLIKPEKLYQFQPPRIPLARPPTPALAAAGAGPEADTNTITPASTIAPPSRTIQCWSDDDGFEGEEAGGDKAGDREIKDVLSATTHVVFLKEFAHVAPVSPGALVGWADSTGPSPHGALGLVITAAATPATSTMAESTIETVDSTAKRTELRRLKHRRKRHPTANKRSKLAEEQARRAETHVANELVPIKQVLEATRAVFEETKKKLSEAERVLVGKKRKMTGEDEEEKQAANRKKKR
jgi:hypothetical protein